MLGVLFTIPLRRALVTNSDLPYPEGVAAAEVLRSRLGHARRGEGRDRRIARRAAGGGLGAVASGGLAILAATRIAAGGGHGVLPDRRVGAASGYDIAWSLALVGAGYLVGLSVGMAMLRRAGDRVGRGGADPHLDACRCRPA